MGRGGRGVFRDIPLEAMKKYLDLSHLRSSRYNLESYVSSTLILIMCYINC